MNYIIPLTAFLCLWKAGGAYGDLLVTLPYGTLRGRDLGNYYSFQSIPYAVPPVGALRFEAPQPFSGEWSEIFDASKPAEECLQWNQFVRTPNKLTGIEDCLTISIFKPKNDSRTSFPVVASLNGGTWSFGGTTEDEAREFMASGNVIVAKINHRVGLLGFANTGDAGWSGNYGLKDQRLAILWIKDNIAQFGGDPDNIMLMGFSSGAASVHFQLLHEDMKDIVKGAYSMSGTALEPWAVQPSGREQAYHLGRILGCHRPKSTAELKECLKGVEANKLVTAFKQFLLFNFVPFAPFGPAVEPEDTVDPFITKLPIDIIRSGKFAQVPWLVGYTPENGIYNAAMLLSKNTNGKEHIYELNTRWYELAPHLLCYSNTMNRTEKDIHSRNLKQQYLGNKNFSVSSYWDVQRMFTNEIFKNGVELGVEMHRKYSKSPVYVYIYDNPADHSLASILSKRKDVFLGTGHGDDYFLLMSNPIRKPLRADEKIISWKLVKMLEGFLQSGYMIYDKCEFPDNVGMKQFQFVIIRRNRCEVVQSDRLPDTVSNNLPLSPITSY